MADHGHGNQANKAAQAEEERIMKEMMPYLIHAVWPILIIVFIAKMWGPSY